MRPRSTCAVALAALAACATPPSASVATPVGIVRADDLATARWIAAELQRAALRLERLSPPLPAPELEAWVVADPGNGVEGIVGTAKRSAWTGRWTLRVDAERGHAEIGHELFHARYHDALRGWTAALVEGLADRFGLSDDILGDCVRTDLLLVLARRPLPALTLVYESSDRTYAGLRSALWSTSTSGPPPLDLERIGAITSSELTALAYEERLYAYAIGYAAALRWLGEAEVLELPGEAPAWAELLQESPEELASSAAGELGPERMHRWAVARFSGELASILWDCPAPLGSVDEALATLEFSICIDDGPVLPLNDDPDFRELLEVLWPWIADGRRDAGAP